MLPKEKKIPVFVVVVLLTDLDSLAERKKLFTHYIDVEVFVIKKHYMSKNELK